VIKFTQIDLGYFLKPRELGEINQEGLLQSAQSAQASPAIAAGKRMNVIV
jgi:hypothetical protein